MADFFSVLDFSLTMSQWLDRLLVFCLTLSISVLTINSVLGSIKRKFLEGFAVGLTSLCVVLVSFTWMMLYISALVFEKVGLDAATSGVEPAVRAEYIAVPVLMSIIFPLFVANSWRIGLAIFGALLVSLLDLYGNSQLISAFYCVQGNFASAGAPDLRDGLKIWIDYYLTGGHLYRVTIYFLMLVLAAFFYTAWSLPEFKDHEDDSALLKELKQASNSYKFTYRACSVALFISAIAMNEAWTWSVRLDREASLEQYGLSVFYGSLSFKRIITDDAEIVFIEQVRTSCF